MPQIIFSSMATLVVHHITQICEIYSFVRILELLGEWWSQTRNQHAISLHILTQICCQWFMSCQFGLSCFNVLLDVLLLFVLCQNDFFLIFLSSSLGLFVQLMLFRACLVLSSYTPYSTWPFYTCTIVKVGSPTCLPSSLGLCSAPLCEYEHLKNTVIQMCLSRISVL